MPKILLIEDDKVLSKALAEELKDDGFEIVSASDGEEGFRAVFKERPDLILLDIVMPKMDGMSMMKKLRESSEFGKHIPIIILTNLNVDNNIMGGITENEPAYYLVKSDYTLAEVVAKVKDCLREVKVSS